MNLHEVQYAYINKVHIMIEFRSLQSTSKNNKNKTPTTCCSIPNTNSYLCIASLASSLCSCLRQNIYSSERIAYSKMYLAKKMTS